MSEPESATLQLWWLGRMTDDQLAALVSGLNGHDVTAAGVATVRAALAVGDELDDELRTRLERYV